MPNGSSACLQVSHYGVSKRFCYCEGVGIQVIRGRAAQSQVVESRGTFVHRAIPLRAPQRHARREQKPSERRFCPLALVVERGEGFETVAQPRLLFLASDQSVSP